MKKMQLLPSASMEVEACPGGFIGKCLNKNLAYQGLERTGVFTYWRGLIYASPMLLLSKSGKASFSS